MTSELEGAVALVVGGAGAIGGACAEALRNSGADVVVADITGEVDTSIDVTDPDSVRKAVAVAGARGPLRIAVNVAGVGGPVAPLHEYGDEDWQRVIDVNLNGVFRCVREEIRAMLAADPVGASIVNIGSITGQTGMATASAYSASKHGLDGLTRTAALEYAAVGIRVNAVAPGFIGTELLRTRRPGEALERLAANHPIGRLGTPQEIGDVVAFLCTPRASFVTGSILDVDGGFLAGRPSLL